MKSSSITTLDLDLNMTLVFSRSRNERASGLFLVPFWHITAMLNSYNSLIFSMAFMCYASIRLILSSMLCYVNTTRPAMFLIYNYPAFLLQVHWRKRLKSWTGCERIDTNIQSWVSSCTESEPSPEHLFCIQFSSWFAWKTTRSTKRKSSCRLSDHILTNPWAVCRSLVLIFKREISDLHMHSGHYMTFAFVLCSLSSVK